MKTVERSIHNEYSFSFRDCNSCLYEEVFYMDELRREMISVAQSKLDEVIQTLNTGDENREKLFSTTL